MYLREHESYLLCTFRGTTSPKWLRRMSPSLDHSCVSSSPPSSASWLGMSSSPAWWRWHPASTFLRSTARISSSWSAKHSGRKGSWDVLGFLEAERKSLLDLSFFSNLLQRSVWMVTWVDGRPGPSPAIGRWLHSCSTQQCVFDIFVPDAVILQQSRWDNIIWFCVCVFSLLLIHQPSVKAVLFFLKLRKMVTMTLERKLFDIITSSPNVEQKMRAGETQASWRVFQMSPA